MCIGKNKVWQSVVLAMWAVLSVNATESGVVHPEDDGTGRSCVACIGDGIALDSGAVPGITFPEQLQMLLGGAWCVEGIWRSRGAGVESVAGLFRFRSGAGF